MTILSDGIPCEHPGCLHHASHPCEGCGRVLGSSQIDVYCDGGVIKKNPSVYGGTWAWVHVKGGLVVNSGSGWISPMAAMVPSVTNNLTEMLAALYAMGTLPETWCGKIYSDSQITLGRLFKGYKWNGIPEWVHEMFRKRVARLKNWEQVTPVLLQGHPTKAELALGVGKSGYKVSEFNVMCDKMCKHEAEIFWEIPF